LSILREASATRSWGNFLTLCQDWDVDGASFDKSLLYQLHARLINQQIHFFSSRFELTGSQG
jgi:hypothetical protein